MHVAEAVNCGPYQCFLSNMKCVLGFSDISFTCQPEIAELAKFYLGEGMW